MKASRQRILAHVASLCLAVATSEAPQAASVRPKAPAVLVHWQPMIFFVAKGTRDACGTGCSEWIAAEGDFDPDAPQRLRDLLVSLNGRDLPIYFNSSGGFMGKAREVGRILREHKMAANVGKTIPEGCRAAEASDESCRRLIQGRGAPTAQLRTGDARCYSACVEAFVGAAVRQVPAGARMGVHATHLESNGRAEKAPPDEDEYFGRKRYLVEMGVDPALVDAAERVRFDQIHVMTRQEIARFGIETRGPYETPWMLDRNSPHLTLLKSVTRAERADGADYRTGVVRIWCESPSGFALSYRRDLRSSERGIESTVRLGIGGRDFVHGREGGDAIELSQIFADLEFFRTAVSADIVITEAFSPRNAQGWSSVTKLATTGLSRMLGEWLGRCADPKPVGVPSGGVAR